MESTGDTAAYGLKYARAALLLGLPDRSLPVSLRLAESNSPNSPLYQAAADIAIKSMVALGRYHDALRFLGGLSFDVAGKYEILRLSLLLRLGDSDRGPLLDIDTSAPGDGEYAVFLRGSAALAAGNPDEAHRELSRITHMPDGGLHRALALYAMGRWSDAVDILATLCGDSGGSGKSGDGAVGPLALETLARIYAEQGRYMEAYDALVRLPRGMAADSERLKGLCTAVLHGAIWAALSENGNPEAYLNLMEGAHRCGMAACLDDGLRKSAYLRWLAEAYLAHRSYCSDLLGNLTEMGVPSDDPVLCYIALRLQSRKAAADGRSDSDGSVADMASLRMPEPARFLPVRAQAEVLWRRGAVDGVYGLIDELGFDNAVMALGEANLAAFLVTAGIPPAMMKPAVGLLSGKAIGKFYNILAEIITWRPDSEILDAEMLVGYRLPDDIKGSLLDYEGEAAAGFASLPAAFGILGRNVPGETLRILLSGLAAERPVKRAREFRAEAARCAACALIRQLEFGKYPQGVRKYLDRISKLFDVKIAQTALRLDSSVASFDGGDLKKAETYGDAAMESKAEYPEVVKAKALIAERGKDWETSYSALCRLYELWDTMGVFGRRADLERELAMMTAKSSQYGTDQKFAISVLERLRRRNPGDVDLLRELMNLYAADGNKKKRDNLMRAWMELEPENAAREALAINYSIRDRANAGGLDRSFRESWMKIFRLRRQNPKNSLLKELADEWFDFFVSNTERAHDRESYDEAGFCASMVGEILCESDDIDELSVAIWNHRAADLLEKAYNAGEGSSEGLEDALACLERVKNLGGFFADDREFKAKTTTIRKLYIQASLDELEDECGEYRTAANYAESILAMLPPREQSVERKRLKELDDSTREEWVRRFDKIAELLKHVKTKELHERYKKVRAGILKEIDPQLKLF